MQKQPLLNLAKYAAKQSAPLFIKNFGNAKNVQMKNNDPRNLVTEIDKAIENNIRKIIKSKFPKHKIIGEEFNKDTLEKNDICWIIDPIDGTTNYIQGLPLCCISIAVWDSQGPLAAVVFNPVSNQLYTAQRGSGAYLNGKKIKVSQVSKLSSSFGAIGWVERESGIKLFAKIIHSCRKLRSLATSALQTSMVGNSILDFYLTHDIHIWDFAAAILIVTEAGGKVTDLQGNKPDLKTSSLLASNGKIHSSLLKLANTIIKKPVL